MDRGRGSLGARDRPAVVKQREPALAPKRRSRRWRPTLSSVTAKTGIVLSLAETSSSVMAGYMVMVSSVSAPPAQMGGRQEGEVALATAVAHGGWEVRRPRRQRAAGRTAGKL